MYDFFRSISKGRVALKRKIINFIKCILTYIPLKKVIIFESVPDVEGNTRAVFDEMIRQNMNEQYKLVWLVRNLDNMRNDLGGNVYFYKKPKNLIEKIIYILKYFNVAAKVSENDCYPKFHQKTLALHLGHGSPIKDTGTLMYIDGAADYVTYKHESLKEITAKLHNLNEDQLLCLGYPRNDNLLKGNAMKCAEKFIVWLPTFRKFDDDRVDSQYYFPFGVPIFKEQSEIERLNVILAKNDTVLYIKPHFVSQLELWDDIACSHIQIITEDYYKNKGLLLYEFLGMSQALITDYSSVYFDYLLVDKPIGITLDDLHEYEKGRGFIFDDFKDAVKGEYIYEYEQLEQFVLNCIHEKIDTKQLVEMKFKYNHYTDNGSSKRVVNFIKQQLGE